MRGPSTARRFRTRVIRGVALAITLIAMFIMATIIFTAASIATLNLRSAQQDAAASEAYYVAMYGIQYARTQLMPTTTPTSPPQWWPASSQPLPLGPPYVPNGTRTLTYSDNATKISGQAAVTVTPLNNNILNNSISAWIVSSTSQVGSYSRTITATLQLSSFSRYLLFANNMGGVAFVNGQSFDGPVHTNGHFRFNGNPTFTSAVTSANGIPQLGNPNWDDYGDGILSSALHYHSWVISTYYPNDMNGWYFYSDPSYYYHVTQSSSEGYLWQTWPCAGPSPDPTNGGNFSFNGAQANIAMPTSAPDITANANYTFTPATPTPFSSWAPTPSPTSSPAPVPAASFTFNADGSITMTPAVALVDSATPVANSYSAGVPTTIPANTTSTTINFIDGNISVSGTVHNPITVACQCSSSTDTINGNILITNNINYVDTSLGSTDKLGLVAANNVVISTWNGTTSVSPLTVDAMMMAMQGKVIVQNYDTMPASGTLTFFGGVANWINGPRGTQQLGVLASGYTAKFSYDSRMLDNPPPNYPNTGLVGIINFTDSGALGH